MYLPSCVKGHCWLSSHGTSLNLTDAVGFTERPRRAAPGCQLPVTPFYQTSGSSQPGQRFTRPLPAQYASNIKTTPRAIFSWNVLCGGIFASFQTTVSYVAESKSRPGTYSRCTYLAAKARNFRRAWV